MEQGKGTEKSDVELMTAASDGSLSSFETLYNRYARRLRDFFYGLARNAETAEDLCQETFARVWKLRERYTATGSFPAYLYSFARNIWMERCRQIKRRRLLGFAIDLESEQDRLRAQDPLPDALASRSETEALVFNILDILPDEQRMVIIMRLVQDMSLADIAEVMNCPVNTVRSRKLLAIKKLRRHMLRSGTRFNI